MTFVAVTRITCKARPQISVNWLQVDEIKKRAVRPLFFCVQKLARILPYIHNFGINTGSAME